MSDPDDDTDDVDALALDAVRQALIEGEQSGEPERFDFAAFKQRKYAQHG